MKANKRHEFITLSIKQERQFTHNIPMRGVHTATFGVEKQ